MYARDYALIATPIGMVRVLGTEQAVNSIAIEQERAPEHRATGGAVAMAAEQLAAWFSGDRTVFDLALAPAMTARGAALRDAMIGIGYGETIAYGALARQIGSSARAIGQACARNPFPIVVPCHRVLNADGGLGAYSAGSGAATKRWLLEHERRHSIITQL